MRAVELDTAASQAVDDFSAQTGLPLKVIVGRLLGWFAIQEKAVKIGVVMHPETLEIRAHLHPTESPGKRVQS